MTDTTQSLDIMAMVSEIVASYVSNHEMEQDKVPAFIQQIHQSLTRLNSKQSAFFSTRSEPAVPIDESVKPDYIVCLEDGLHLKMLKRHLKTSYNMTPEQYRERWNLPSNYPMVAPNYAMRRSSIAKGIGLGHRRKGTGKKAAA
jgi:predicted transcriptional regulator